MARVMGDSASTGTGAYASAFYIGLSANAAAPSAGDTVLTGELGGSLARAAAAYGHTNGTSSYTLSKTFTSDANVTLAKIAVFNAASSGTMLFVALLNTTAVLVIGDQIQISLVVTL